MILYHAGPWNGGGTGSREGGRIALLREGVELWFLLVSFAIDVGNAVEAYAGQVAELRAAGARRIFLDSGAFSAWSTGATVNLPDLYEAIDALHPDVYAQLDVIGDPDATRANLERMRADGYRPLPVFTRGAPWAHLDRLLDEEDYIAVGGIARVKGPVRMEWCRSVFARTHAWMQRTGKPLPRFHALGVAGQEMLEAFPFYSADSATALMTSAVGETVEFRDGKLRRLRLLDQRHAEKAPHLADRFAGERMYVQRRVACFDALNAMARHVTKVWALRGVTWPDQQEHPC